MCAFVKSSLFWSVFSRPDVPGEKKKTKQNPTPLPPPQKNVLLFFFAIRANALAFFATRQKYFRPLLQRGLRAILRVLKRPPLVPSSWPAQPLTITTDKLLQHLLSREISTQSFTHLLFLLCSLSSSLFFPLCSNPPPPLLPTSQSLPSVFAPHPPSQLFLCRLCRYRARVEKVESPAKVHVFYIDYGNVSTLWFFPRTTTQLGAVWNIPLRTLSSSFRARRSDA